MSDNPFEIKSEIKLKGLNNGLLIILPKNKNWKELVQDLGHLLDKSKNLWIGASTTVDLKDYQLDETQIFRLHEMLNKRYHLNLEGIYSQDDTTRKIAESQNFKAEEFLPGVSKYTRDSIVEPVPEKPSEIVNEPNNNSQQNNALYIKNTLRSGQLIRHDGNVIIYGDVNPGAEVLASGDIIILGTLRGVAHAGARGDETAKIISVDLRPTQLRISTHIARAPDKKRKSATGTSIAKIENGMIAISLLKDKK